MTTDAQDSYKYAGISNVDLKEDFFDFGHDIILRRTYAHLMSPNIMAFSPALPSRPHPAPWRPAKGGSSIDISLELCIPNWDEFPAEDVIWWIAALLRLSAYPFLVVPVISDVSFSEAAYSEKEPVLHPFEIQTRILHADDPEIRKIDVNDLKWVKNKWRVVRELAQKDSALKTAIDAWNYSTVSGRTSSSMLAVWGALEQLFSPTSAELRFRVSTSIASFLEKPGANRLKLYKEILSLYNERSKAAHTAEDIQHNGFIQSWVILRNALIKIIDNEKIPTQADLEELIFCGS
jgi:hypothetical protein